MASPAMLRMSSASAPAHNKTRQGDETPCRSFASSASTVIPSATSMVPEILIKHDVMGADGRKVPRISRMSTFSNWMQKISKMDGGKHFLTDQHLEWIGKILERLVQDENAKVPPKNHREARRLWHQARKIFPYFPDWRMFIGRSRCDGGGNYYPAPRDTVPSGVLYVSESEEYHAQITSLEQVAKEGKGTPVLTPAEVYNAAYSNASQHLASTRKPISSGQLKTLTITAGRFFQKVIHELPDTSSGADKEVDALSNGEGGIRGKTRGGPSVQPKKSRDHDVIKKGRKESGSQSHGHQRNTQDHNDSKSTNKKKSRHSESPGESQSRSHLGNRQGHGESESRSHLGNNRQERDKSKSIHPKKSNRSAPKVAPTTEPDESKSTHEKKLKHSFPTVSPSTESRRQRREYKNSKSTHKKKPEHSCPTVPPSTEPRRQRQEYNKSKSTHEKKPKHSSPIAPPSTEHRRHRYRNHHGDGRQSVAPSTDSGRSHSSRPHSRRDKKARASASTHRHSRRHDLTDENSPSPGTRMETPFDVQRSHQRFLGRQQQSDLTTSQSVVEDPRYLEWCRLNDQSFEQEKSLGVSLLDRCLDRLSERHNERRRIIMEKAEAHFFGAPLSHSAQRGPRIEGRYNNTPMVPHRIRYSSPDNDNETAYFSAHSENQEGHNTMDEESSTDSRGSNASSSEGHTIGGENSPDSRGSKASSSEGHTIDGESSPDSRRGRKSSGTDSSDGDEGTSQEEHTKGGESSPDSHGYIAGHSDDNEGINRNDLSGIDSNNSIDSHNQGGIDSHDNDQSTPPDSINPIGRGSINSDNSDASSSGDCSSSKPGGRSSIESESKSYRSDESGSGIAIKSYGTGTGRHTDPSIPKKIGDHHSARGNDGHCRGLVNPCQWCYMNSTIQMLATLPWDKLGQEAGPVTKAFLHVLHSLSSSGPPTTIQPLISAMLAQGLHFDGETPEDPQEFLLALLNLLQVENPSALEHLYHVLAKRNFCLNCHREWGNEDRGLDLQIPVPKQQCTLKECLGRALDKEDSDGDFKCEKCHCCRVQTRCNLTTCPEILIVQLLRYGIEPADENTPDNVERIPMKGIDHVLTKISTHVEVSEYVTVGHETYQLTAALKHKGSGPRSGHCTLSTVCTGDSKTWWHLDDASVTKISSISEAQGPSEEIPCLLLLRRLPRHEPENHPNITKIKSHETDRGSKKCSPVDGLPKVASGDKSDTVYADQCEATPREVKENCRIRVKEAYAASHSPKVAPEDKFKVVDKCKRTHRHPEIGCRIQMKESYTGSSVQGGKALLLTGRQGLVQEKSRGLYRVLFSVDGETFVKNVKRTSFTIIG